MRSNIKFNSKLSLLLQGNGLFKRTRIVFEMELFVTKQSEPMIQQFKLVFNAWRIYFHFSLKLY